MIGKNGFFLPMISKHFLKFNTDSILVAKDKKFFNHQISFSHLIFYRHSPDIKKPKTLENKGFRRCLLASIKGFEPSAYRLGGDRSIQLSYMDVCNFRLSLDEY